MIEIEPKSAWPWAIDQNYCTDTNRRSKERIQKGPWLKGFAYLCWVTNSKQSWKCSSLRDGRPNWSIRIYSKSYEVNG